MPMSFVAVGTLDVNPFVADGDPNTSAPAATRIFNVPDANEQGARSIGVRFFIEMLNVVGTPTYDIRPWVFDEVSSKWVALALASAVGRRVLFVSTDCAPGRVFLQVTANPAGSADELSFFAAAA
jgi:hypothetical protein